MSNPDNIDLISNKDWTKVVDVDFPRIDITKKMKARLLYQSLNLRGSVRLMVGKLSTTEEIEERRHRALEPL